MYSYRFCLFVCFLKMLFIKLRKFLSFPVSLGFFIMNILLYCVHCFFFINGMIMCSFFFFIFSVFLCLLGCVQGFLVAGRDWSGRNGGWSILAEPEVSESSFSREFYTVFLSALYELLTLTEDINFHTVLECVISVAVQYILCLRQVSALNSLK